MRRIKLKRYFIIYIIILLLLYDDVRIICVYIKRSYVEVFFFFNFFVLIPFFLVFFSFNLIYIQSDYNIDVIVQHLGHETRPRRIVPTSTAVITSLIVVRFPAATTAGRDIVILPSSESTSRKRWPSRRLLTVKVRARTHRRLLLLPRCVVVRSFRGEDDRETGS